MTANAIFGLIGTLLGGAACFCLGYNCALRRGAAELDNDEHQARVLPSPECPGSPSSFGGAE